MSSGLILITGSSFDSWEILDEKKNDLKEALSCQSDKAVAAEVYSTERERPNFWQKNRLLLPV